MKARLGVFLLCITVSLFAGTVPALGQPQVTAEAAALMDADSGVFYFAKNAAERRPMASLTKVMTCILAQELADLDERVEVSPRAAGVSVGSIIDLHNGEEIKLRELVKAALICSANDATVAIGEDVAGDHDAFVRWMNAKALLLGMSGSRFANTNGYSHPSHYSTAADLAALARYSLRNPLFAGVVRTRQANVRWIKPQRNEQIESTNEFLHSGFPGITGVKTGTTDAAGKCLIASVSRHGRNLIAVVLRSGDRYGDASQLLTWGLKEVVDQVACTGGEYFTRLKVRGGRLPDVPLGAENELVVSLPREELVNIRKEVRIYREPVAPVKAGDRFGEVIFTWKGQELGRTGLIAGRTVERRPWYRTKTRGYF
ncbi:MAG: D-alanyl-D-alanine carboxypeptidase family protein [Bacillota bacterium]